MELSCVFCYFCHTHHEVDTLCVMWYGGDDNVKGNRRKINCNKFNGIVFFPFRAPAAVAVALSSVNCKFLGKLNLKLKLLSFVLLLTGEKLEWTERRVQESWKFRNHTYNNNSLSLFCSACKERCSQSLDTESNFYGFVVRDFFFCSARKQPVRDLCSSLFVFTIFCHP